MTHPRDDFSEPGFALRFGWSAKGILCALFIAQVVVFPSRCEAIDASVSVDARLRLDWKSEQAGFWNVRLQVIDAASDVPCVSEVENLSESDRTTAAFELSSDSRSLMFQPRHAVRGGAVRFRIRASSQAKLSLAVVSGAGADALSKTQVPVKEFLLSELIDQGTASSEDEGLGEIAGKPTWSLSRIANDQLRIENLRRVPVYQPDEQLSFSVHSSALIRYAFRQLTLQHSLYRISDGQSVWSHRSPVTIDAHGNSEAITIDEAVPTLPGVYEIRCQLVEDDDNIWSRLRRRGPPIAHIGRPIVVSQQQQSQLTASQPNWQIVGEIRPSHSSWSVGQWLPKPTTFIPGSSAKKTGPQSTVDLASQVYGSESISLIPPHNTFQATLPVLEPGLPHKVTIRYPAARSIKIRVDVATTDSRMNPAASFVLASDPDFDRSDGWKTYTFLHYPTNDDQIWLTNLDPSAPASFESISVRAGPSHLMPGSIDAPDQTSDPRMAVLRLVDMAWVESLSTDLNNAASLAQCEPETVALCRLWVAAERLGDYVRASGMKAIVVPANTVGQTWFASTTFFPRRDGPEHHPDRLATFLQLMERSNLHVFVGLEPNMLLSDVEQAIRQQPKLSANLTRGHGMSSHLLKFDQYNSLHPLVQESLASLLGELDQQCGEYSCFAGIVLQCDAASHTEPLRNASNDPDIGTLTLFAQSTGTEQTSQTGLTVLRTWIGGPGKNDFETWLRDETRRLYARLGRSVSNKALVMVMKPRSGVHGEGDEFQLNPFAQNWRGDGATLVPAETFCYGPDHLLGKKFLLQQQLSSATDGAAASHATRAAILANEAGQTDEEPAVARDRLISDVGRVIDRIDPSLLMVELPNGVRRLQDELARTLRAFSTIPAENMRRMDSTDPASQTLHVSVGTNDGHACVSIISLVPWTSEVQFESFTPIDWVQVGEAQPSSENMVRQTSGTHATVVVPAGQLIVLRSKTPVTDGIIRSWTSRVSGGDETLEKITRQVTLIVERIGILSDFDACDALTNGGFEQFGEMGLVGWLHAQHPPGCVRIDDKEFVEGKHSVLLTTDPAAATRTWIVSEKIDPPRSGRLAVSLAARGESQQGDSDHRLRVSIEATRDRKPVRFSSEFGVPRNGQWGSRKIVLETDGIDNTTVGSLRLTIDSLSGGRVWIDDVRLHDQFPTAKERADVQSQAFLAVQGLQRGNLTPAGRLLQNHWARHLLTLKPAPQAKRVMAAPPQVAPGVADRIRSWLPRPLRF